jgi:sugar lactone lactonase YvrE
MRKPVLFVLTFMALLVLDCRKRSVSPERTVEEQSAIITFAGGGTADGGAATEARLNAPNGLAVDSKGNLYIADTGNDRIRMVSSGGVISTIAGNGSRGYGGDGGAARGASLNTPTDVTVDAAGNVYIADQGNHRIRRVTPDGTIRTVAGSGSPGFGGDGGTAVQAGLNSPSAVRIDKAGNLLIADRDNHRIRRVATDGRISTLAGNGTAGYNGDSQEARLASLNKPSGLTVDASGNLLIADRDNHRIRRVSADGMIATVAGNGTLGYNGDGLPATAARLNFPTAVAVDADGNLLIADHWNFRVRRVSARDGSIGTLTGSGSDRFGGDGQAAAAASVSFPAGIAVDPSGNILITDRGNQRIRRIGKTSAIIQTVAGSGNVGFCGDGLRADGSCLYNPTGITVDGKGNLYLVDQGNQRVRRISPEGVMSTLAGNGKDGFSGEGGSAAAASLRYPSEVAVDASGNVYVSDQLNNRIRRVDAASGLITTVAGSQFEGHSGDGGPATAARLSGPAGLAVDAGGNLLVADYRNNRIRRVSADGIISTIAGTGVAGFAGDGGRALDARLSYPTGVAVGPGGSIYVCDRGNHRVRKIALDGTITTVAGNGMAGFSGDQGIATGASLKDPTSLAIDAKGNLYLADTGNNRIRRVGADDGIITTVAGTGRAGLSGDFGPAPDASFDRPVSITIDRSGFVYVVDQWNHRIRRFK